MNLERKQLDFTEVEIKAGPNGHGRLFGYAATYGNVDRQNDVILHGAFAHSLDFFKTSGFIAVGHDHDGLPIATVDIAREDMTGLWVEADFHSTPTAQEARTVMQERIERGKSVTLSIGYAITPEGVAFRDDGVRVLKRLDVYEASLANIPANPGALVSGVKSGSLAGLTFKDHSEAVLAAVNEYIARVKEIADLRAERKSGRMFSAQNMDTMMSIHESMQSSHEAMGMSIEAMRELMERAAPKDGGTGAEKSADPEAIKAYLRYVASKHNIAIGAQIQ